MSFFSWLPNRTSIQSTRRDGWQTRPSAPPFRPRLEALEDRCVPSTRESHDRHYAALLLRTSSARESILVLRAALRNRDKNAAPVEEMLLALAHARLNQRADALGYLRTALAWMRPATAPVRAASLAGLGATNPLAALTDVAVRQPDPRLDHQTNRELLGLCAEAEKALADANR
jgi:hypothetical protein